MLSLLSGGSVIRLMSPFTSFLCLLIRVSSYLLLDEDVVVEISEHELVIIVEEFGAALVEHRTADRDVDFLGDADAGLLRSFLPLARHFGLLHSDERHTEVIAVFITVSSFCCSFSMEYQTNLWDITLGVSLGSATQISMFVVPLCVMVAWITGIKMDLDLNLLETGSLIMAILVIAFTLQDGTSHYLKGLVPLLCYLAIGACFFVFKSPLEKGRNLDLQAKSMKFCMQKTDQYVKIVVVIPMGCWRRVEIGRPIGAKARQSPESSELLEEKCGVGGHRRREQEDSIQVTGEGARGFRRSQWSRRRRGARGEEEEVWREEEERAALGRKRGV
ncbi:hypothetical protein ZIOFF_002631 [Zingiber officinale]|uniref:Sodium/calcium exchanger membrane region domain-containing protein n=1 Tax=Zingiber officinale TaxID=94328 RepID=A0A8J5I008_ZINOF|nr:hypothetical protein ZIOFF_002631 [Zingiber officinale]